MQDAFKIVTYYLVLKFDIFQASMGSEGARTRAAKTPRPAPAGPSPTANCRAAHAVGPPTPTPPGPHRRVQARTGALVNLREAFSTKDNDMADGVTGMVETKLLDKKVAAVEEQVRWGQMEWEEHAGGGGCSGRGVGFHRWESACGPCSVRARLASLMLLLNTVDAAPSCAPAGHQDCQDRAARRAAAPAGAHLQDHRSGPHLHDRRQPGAHQRHPDCAAGGGDRGEQPQGG